MSLSPSVLSCYRVVTDMLAREGFSFEPSAHQSGVQYCGLCREQKGLREGEEQIAFTLLLVCLIQAEICSGALLKVH